MIQTQLDGKLMLEIMEVSLPGEEGSLTLLSSIRTIIGSLIRGLCEILSNFNRLV